MAKKTILVVEDNKDIRESLEQVLLLEGYAIQSAQNGKEALDLLPTIHSPCLILLDWLMPVMNGSEFLNHLDSIHEYKHLPVIVFSAAGMNLHSIDQKIQKRAFEFLRKPIELEALLRILSQFCD